MPMLDALPLGDLLAGAGWASGYMMLVWVLIRHNDRIARGDLVPRKTHEDALRTIELQQKRLDLQAETGGAMADALSTVEAFIASLPRPPANDRRPARGGRG